MEPGNVEAGDTAPPQSAPPSLGTAPINRFDLSLEQKNTASLLQELLGKTFADRYVDFCRLAAGAFELRVSRPVAAHALRELESSLRQVLEAPMEAKTPDEVLDPAKRRQAEEKLRELNFSEDDIRAAVKGSRSPGGRHSAIGQPSPEIQRPVLPRRCRERPGSFPPVMGVDGRVA